MKFVNKIERYAPWCPACKDLNPTWNYLGDIKKDLGIYVGKVDVTALPTIYHVTDGLFRQYKSPRDKDSLVEFVRAKTWTKVEPIPSWKSLTSIQMSRRKSSKNSTELLQSLSSSSLVQARSHQVEVLERHLDELSISFDEVKNENIKLKKIIEKEKK
ncbi:hypothetical protein HCN44_006009 [Aphidius gifuensis]|uniref:Thioredoxin domain-containing protein n=1 Tax=Aphidius gifuensis TaxID=684658 RepID=A0A834Y1F2_APHGI|nr:hypothetical protein HCN44_006009 [Aphidius gifuensis]